MFVELPFQNADDEAADGDMPYDAMVLDVPYDIEDDGPTCIRN
ncbi:hypothetical protein MHEL_41280 [Mycolicibacterium helvum]|uniref:Uncharacterized protein n=1 Tax=Mycolicibacterium helvum TaxID=1534349 RepID=A0A7I7TC00_9MYCO|nr:hypothetical protein MHEL_41280 [Mycolicibacterium helvum]